MWVGTIRTGAQAGATWGRRLARRWRSPRLKWPKRIALGLAVLLVVPVLTAGIALRLTYAGDVGDGTRTRGRDAIGTTSAVP